MEIFNATFAIPPRERGQKAACACFMLQQLKLGLLLIRGAKGGNSAVGKTQVRYPTAKLGLLPEELRGGILP